MASDRAPLLRSSPTDGNDGLERLSGAPSSPADPAIASSTGGDGTRDTNYSSRSGDRTQTQVEEQNAEDDELTDEEQEDDEEARYRDPRYLLPRSSAERSRCAPRVAAACRGNLTAFVVAAGVCLLGVGASVGIRARFRRAGEVGTDGDTAASLWDGRPLPQCYSTSTADPSIGAWRKCDGGAGECSPMGNATLPEFMPQMERRCSERWASEHQGNKIMPYWTWGSSNCRLEKVDAEKFCRVMEGRKGILFAGDSLTGQAVDTLAAILRAELLDHEKLSYDKFSACGGALKFSWYRNDYLDPRTTASGGFETVHCEVEDVSMSHCMVFGDDSVLGEYDTLVVNSGAHRRRGGIEAYGEMMRNSSAILAASMNRLHGDDAILVVRNTVPGHGDPDNDKWDKRTFAGPVDIDAANSIVAEGKPLWRWAAFHDKNKLLEEAFGPTSWALLDAYTPTVLRPDMHADGLHYCCPGPLDHWITLLYNILLVETAARA